MPRQIRGGSGEIWAPRGSGGGRAAPASRTRCLACAGGNGRRAVDLSHASAGRPHRAGRLPDLRHGPGADDADRRRSGQPRAQRDDAPVLGGVGVVGAAVAARHGGACLRSPAGRSAVAARFGVGPTRPRDARGAVGRMAVLRARLAVPRQPQSQHVHADRHRHRRRLCLQHRGDAGPRDIPRLLPRRGRRGGGLFRGGRGHHHPGAPGSGAGAARALADQRRHSRAPRSRAEDGADPARRRQRGGYPAGASPARRSPARPSRREGPGGRDRARGAQRRR